MTKEAAAAAAQQSKADKAELLKLLEQAEGGLESDSANKPADSAAEVVGEVVSGDKQDQKPVKAEVTPDKATDERKKKEDERYDRNWKKFAEEKALLREEREKVKSDLAELEELRALRLTSESNSQASEYESLAKDFESEGNAEAARLARVKATEARKQASDRVYEEKSKRFAAEWRGNYEKLAEQNPELYDETSDLYKSVDALVRAEPMLRSMPDGINKAFAFVKNSISASSVDKLKADIAERDARIAELTKKTSLGGSNPVGIQGEKSFGTMSHKEQRAHLLAMAKEADGNFS